MQQEPAYCAAGAGMTGAYYLFLLLTPYETKLDQRVFESREMNIDRNENMCCYHLSPIIDYAREAFEPKTHVRMRPAKCSAMI